MFKLGATTIYIPPYEGYNWAVKLRVMLKSAEVGCPAQQGYWSDLSVGQSSVQVGSSQKVECGSILRLE